MKKIKTILIIICVLLLLILLGKAYVYKNYNVEQVVNIKNEGSVVIKHKEVKDYLKYNGVKIRNDFKKYTYEEDDDSYILYNKEDDIVNMFAVYDVDTLLNIFIEYDNSLINKDKVEKYLKDNNINNDMELLNYIEKYKQDINFFSKDFDIKMDYYIKKYVEDVLPLAEEYKVIEGDYTGIIVYGNSYEEEKSIDVLLFEDNRRIVLTFIGMDINEKNILDLVGTVVIYEEE